jgi:hypothetical protein
VFFVAAIGAGLYFDPKLSVGDIIPNAGEVLAQVATVAAIGGVVVIASGFVISSV